MLTEIQTFVRLIWMESFELSICQRVPESLRTCCRCAAAAASVEPRVRQVLRDLWKICAPVSILTLDGCFNPRCESFPVDSNVSWVD